MGERKISLHYQDMNGYRPRASRFTKNNALIPLSSAGIDKNGQESRAETPSRLQQSREPPHTV